MDPFNDPRFPKRPNHDDFWRMSDVILQLDGRMEEAKNDQDRERIFMEVVAEHCDSDSLFYMASQRAFRVLGADTAAKVAANLEALAMLTTVYCESFIAGMEYQKRLAQ